MKMNRLKERLRAGVELMAMAAEACGITAIARPGSRSPEHVLQVLERRCVMPWARE